MVEGDLTADMKDAADVKKNDASPKHLKKYNYLFRLRQLLVMVLDMSVCIILVRSQLGYYILIHQQ